MVCFVLERGNENVLRSKWGGNRFGPELKVTRLPVLGEGGVTRPWVAVFSAVFAPTGTQRRAYALLEHGQRPPKPLRTTKYSDLCLEV